MLSNPHRLKRSVLRVVVVSGACALAGFAASNYLVSSAASGVAASPVSNADRLPAPGTKPQEHGAQIVAGERWSVRSFMNSANQICAGEVVPAGVGEGGTGLTCVNPGDLFARGPIHRYLGARQIPGVPGWANAWIWGWASPAVGSLQLRFTNCTAAPITIDASGMFHLVLGSGTLRQGLGPRELVAFGSDGAVIARVPTVLPAPTPGAVPSQYPACS